MDFDHFFNLDVVLPLDSLQINLAGLVVLDGVGLALVPEVQVFTLLKSLGVSALERLDVFEGDFLLDSFRNSSLKTQVTEQTLCCTKVLVGESNLDSSLGLSTGGWHFMNLVVFF